MPNVNGYRFWSEQYENGRLGLTTCNTSVCVSSYDDSGNIMDYYGVIQDISKLFGKAVCNLSWFYFIVVGLIQHKEYDILIIWGW
jgi:hypothetical protein